jgi:microcystin-dependent protein
MDALLGSIIGFAGNFAPQGWLMCEGQLLPINQNQALFSILGTTYGGDGQTTFALPDLNGKIPGPGPKVIICVEGIYPSRP